VVVFAPLTETEVERICELVCAGVAERLRAERGVSLSVEPALVTRLAREGFDGEFGARPLKRHVRRTLEKELTRAILEGRLYEGSEVRALDAGEAGISLEISDASAVVAA